jgi:GT2 family glycosyltransferase/Tfp pilus assembly protein PilF
VHPYRGEGFGFPIAEAMACGLPVIVTGYGAALDFCSVETAYLIPSREVKYPKKMLGNKETVDYPWLAEPDEEALHDLMHHVIQHSDEAKAKGSRAREFIQAQFTWERAAGVVMERIRKLRTKAVIRFERGKRGQKYKKAMIHGLVSIIIPVTGETKHLKECVQAIRKRSPEPHEVIFADTNSPQDIQKWLKMIARENTNYKFIQTPKSLHPSESLNLGIRESSGEFLLFLNPDVMVTENWLSGLLECLQNARDIGIVGPITNQISGIQRIEEVGYRSLEALDEYARSFREKNRCRRIPSRRIVGFCMLLRRELVDRIGLLDESFGKGNFEDDDFCLRAELAGYRNMIAGDVFVHHFGSRSFAGNGIDYHSALSGNRKKFHEKWNGVDPQTPEGKKLLLLKARESARQLCDREQIDKAIEKLLAGLALEPQDPELHCELAEILMEAKGFEKAIEILKQMPAGFQDERKIALLGYAFERLGKFEEAEEWAQRALAQNGHNASALNLKGILAYRGQKMKEATAFFQKAIEMDKGYGEPYTNLGLMKWSAGQKEEAVSLFEKGFILAPTIPDQIMNYHAAVTEMAQLARAEKYFREAKALHPFHKRIHYLLIDLLLRQGQHAEAMKEIEEAMISFGIDEGILSASLEVRKRIGPKEIPVGEKRNSLSLCMIVKNEEKHLPQCLGSVRDLVDEILIVDTGSGDKTREISTAFGAKVYEFPWRGDFSAARNFSLGQARGKWILILDADERIGAKDLPDLRKLPGQKGNRRVAYSFVTRNYTTNPEVQGWIPNEGIYEEEKGTGWFPSEKVRLFPADSRIRFQGVVHEGVRSSLVDHSVAIEESCIPIHHYGKLDEQRERKKGEEYYLLGKKKLQSFEADVRSLRELAVQAGELKRYAEAAELWNQVITLQPDMAEAYTNLSSLYLKLKKYDQAYAASKQAVTLDPNSKEALLNFSTAGLSRGKTFESIRTLESLLARNPEYPPALGVLSVAYVLHGEKEKSSPLIEKLKRWGFNYAEFLSLMSQEFASMGREKEGQMLHQMILQSEALPSPVCEPGLAH